jgi:hypothetical protein
MKYRQMRELLERLCRQSMQNEQLQMTDLSARISYLASIASLSRNAQNLLHTFRLTSNAVMNRREEPTRENLLPDLSARISYSGTLKPEHLSFFIQNI